MNDTSPEVEALIAERYRAMSGAERVRIAAGMFETARTLVLASLPQPIDGRAARAALCRRLYPELPEDVVARVSAAGDASALP